MKIYYAHTHSPNGGFGVLGKGIMKALQLDPKFNVVNNIPNFPSIDNDSEWEKIPEVDIILTYGMPDLVPYALKLKETQSHRKIKHFHYYVWESSHLPWDFVDMYKKVDQLITASKYSRLAGRHRGLDALIWHHGVDKRFQYMEPQDGKFTFLHHNAYEGRKGTQFLIKAFTEEFSIDEDVKLILKARERHRSVWLIPSEEQLTIQQIKDRQEDPDRFFKEFYRIDHPLIEEIIGHVSDEEMVRINSESDCFVFPAIGEGWGLPPFEAAAMGKVPIMPAYSSFSEWFNPECMLEIKASGYINSEPRYPGYQFIPSTRSIRKQMRWAFEHREEIKEMGKKASKYIHDNYNWAKITNELYNLITQSI